MTVRYAWTIDVAPEKVGPFLANWLEWSNKLQMKAGAQGVTLYATADIGRFVGIAHWATRSSREYAVDQIRKMPGWKNNDEFGEVTDIGWITPLTSIPAVTISHAPDTDQTTDTDDISGDDDA